MAIRFAVYSTPILNLGHASAKGPRNTGLLMCSNNPVSVSLQIRSYDHLKNKVMDDSFINLSNNLCCFLFLVANYWKLKIHIDHNSLFDYFTSSSCFCTEDDDDDDLFAGNL